MQSNHWKPKWMNCKQWMPQVIFHQFKKWKTPQEIAAHFIFLCRATSTDFLIKHGPRKRTIARFRDRFAARRGLKVNINLELTSSGIGPAELFLSSRKSNPFVIGLFSASQPAQQNTTHTRAHIDRTHASPLQVNSWPRQIMECRRQKIETKLGWSSTLWSKSELQSLGEKLWYWKKKLRRKCRKRFWLNWNCVTKEFQGQSFSLLSFLYFFL